MAGVLISSCSTRSWHRSYTRTQLVGHGADSVACCSVLRSRRASCFKSGLPYVDASRSRSRRGGVRTISVRAERPSNGEAPGDGFDNAEISVFRFTLGIPGFEDSELPRVVGVLFGGLIILNHIFSFDSVTPALLRSELVGLFLAAVSISLPALNRQLNGGESSSKPTGQTQVFALADDTSDNQRQELAWSSYTLLQNTGSTAILIWYGGKVLCARGFWEIPTVDGLDAKSSSLLWLDEKLKAKRFSQLENPLYVSSNADGLEMEVIPRGTASLLVQPFLESRHSERESASQGFLLVISTTSQAYRRKDRVWIAAMAKKLSEVLAE